MSDGPWTFGSFELDPAGFRLLTRSRPDPVAIERRPLELLLMLVERHGELVSREEMTARLWGADAEVDTEGGLHTVVRKVRTALGDSAERPRFIETVPGKGYRFIAAVSATLTIAVLPFEDAGGGTADAYLTDGLTESLIRALGRVAPDRLRVIARTSSMVYKHAAKTARAIGHELGAHYIVEGTVRRQDPRLRIATTLVRTRDHVQVWDEVYERSLHDLDTLEHEIVPAIAHHLGVGMRMPAGTAADRPAHDPDAHDLFLRGRWYWHQRHPDAMTKAEQCFKETIAKTPSYAPAHAALASIYVLQILLNTADADVRWTRARLATETALQLDPRLGEAHAAAAMVDFYVGWDWTAAERSFRRAIDLNPNDAIAHQFYAQLLSNLRRHDEAIAEIERARAIDPLASTMHTFAAMMYALAERRDVAFAAVRHALTLDPDHFPAHAVLGHLYDRTGDPDAALEAYRNAHRLSGGSAFLLGFQGGVLGRTGRDNDARQIVATLEQVGQSRHVPPSAFALTFAGMGDRDAAFHHLDRAYSLRDVFLISLPNAHWWDPPPFGRTLCQPVTADRLPASRGGSTMTIIDARSRPGPQRQPPLPRRPAAVTRLSDGIRERLDDGRRRRSHNAWSGHDAREASRVDGRRVIDFLRLFPANSLGHKVFVRANPRAPMAPGSVTRVRARTPTPGAVRLD
jgi:TolB-like protein/Tfp pilus assembly protein PilF